MFPMDLEVKEMEKYIQIYELSEQQKMKLYVLVIQNHAKMYLGK